MAKMLLNRFMVSRCFIAYGRSFVSVPEVSKVTDTTPPPNEGDVNELDVLKGVDARTGEPRVGRDFNYKMELTTLAERLGHDLSLLPSLQTALTHRSACWNGAPQEHNGRLAVLGRAALMHYVQEYVYFKYPNMDAKSLLDICCDLTHNSTLGDLTNQIGITELLLTKVKPSDGKYQDMLGKSFSAVLGAVYCDRGSMAARTIIHNFIIPVLKSSDIRDLIKLHNKPLYYLNQILKREGKAKAEVRLLKETGRLSHFPTYVMGVFSDDKFLGEGSGTSLIRAKNEAVAAAIRKHYMKELKNVTLPSDEDKNTS